jgi:hypothetical protein
MISIQVYYSQNAHYQCVAKVVITHTTGITFPKIVITFLANSFVSNISVPICRALLTVVTVRDKQMSNQSFARQFLARTVLTEITRLNSRSSGRQNLGDKVRNSRMKYFCHKRVMTFIAGGGGGGGG